MSAISRIEYEITPPKRGAWIDWPELWRYRDLFLVLSWRDLSVRYKQTALGVVWALLQPLVTTVIFTFVFNGIAKITSGSATPYPVFVLVGLIFWQFYSGTITKASDSMVTNASIIQKVYFPRLIVPAAALITSLVDMAIVCVFLVIAMIYYGVHPQAMAIAILPLLMATIIMTSLGQGVFCAALNIKYRDVRYALPFFVQTLMYLTPVMYPVKMLDRHPLAKTLMIWLNPVSGTIANGRAALFGDAPIDWPMLWISLLMGFVYFIFGLSYFRRTERYFADIV